ncbi:hypothetical protein PoB_000543000 [Plakobranchus ocellatus]|uniref:Uncharacterized protein n=1 Tax=Plakobranchus ocellatus TaxID=259542 RepID=A0AAV3Y8V1_9GAST|nr:hypothetical protein PoB_000543000 [Plakobranchus ocellatus]
MSNNIGLHLQARLEKLCSFFAKEIQAENRDDVLRQPSSDKRQRIFFPPASSGKQWEDLDSKIVLKIESLLGKAPWSTRLPLSVISSIKPVWTHLERNNTKSNAHHREAGDS